MNEDIEKSSSYQNPFLYNEYAQGFHASAVLNLPHNPQNKVRSISSVNSFNGNKSGPFKHDIVHDESFAWTKTSLTLAGMYHHHTIWQRLSFAWIILICIAQSTFIPVKFISIWKDSEFWVIQIAAMIWTISILGNFFYFSMRHSNWVEKGFDILVESEADQNSIKLFFKYCPLVVWTCFVALMASVAVALFVDVGSFSAILDNLIWPFNFSMAFRACYFVINSWFLLGWLWPLPIVVGCFNLMKSKLDAFKLAILSKKHSFLEIRTIVTRYSEQMEALNQFFSPWMSFYFFTNMILLPFLAYEIFHIADLNYVLILFIMFALLSAYFFVIFYFSAMVRASYLQCLDAASRLKVSDATSQNGLQCILFFESVSTRSIAIKIFSGVEITWDLFLECIIMLGALIFLFATSYNSISI